MNKVLDVFICLGITAFSFILWGIFMIDSSDIPVEVSVSEFRNLLLLMLLFFIIYNVYLKLTQYAILNISLLSISLLLWSISSYQALIYHYHIYDTITGIVGFGVTLIILFRIGYRKFKLQV